MWLLLLLDGFEGEPRGDPTGIDSDAMDGKLLDILPFAGASEPVGDFLLGLGVLGRGSPRGGVTRIEGRIGSARSSETMLVVVMVVVVLSVGSSHIGVGVLVEEDEAGAPDHIFSRGCTFAEELVPFRADREGVPALDDAQ